MRFPRPYWRFPAISIVALGLLASFTATAATRFTLSGAANGASGVTVDDDLDVYLNGTLIYTDAKNGAGTRPAIPVVANIGDTVRLVVRDTFGVCSSLSQVYLRNPTGQGILVDAGFNLGCGKPNVDQGVTHDFSFTIPDFGLQPGDIIASAGYGAVVKVNPTTGMRSQISDFTDAQAGATGFPGNITAGVCGTMYASDQRAQLFRIYPDGTRSLVSDAANATQGPAWNTAFALGLDSDGRVLVTDRGVSGGGIGAGLWSVDPANGFRTRLTDSGAVNGTHSAPESVALDALGNIVIGDAEGPSWSGSGNTCWEMGDCGALFRVNRSSGALSVISDFGNVAQGPRGVDAGHSIALDTDGKMLVVDAYAGNGNGALFRVEMNGPSSGTRTQLTSGIGHSGSVAVGSDSLILIGGCTTPKGDGICRVDRASGVQTVRSDFGNAAQGPTGIALSMSVLKAGAYPAAVSQSVITNKNVAAAVTLAGSDPGGIPLTYTIIMPPLHGVLNGAAPNLTYTPANNYVGFDSFRFVTGNGCGSSASATVTINVQNPVSLDVDLSITATRYDALTGGLLVLRYLFAISGPSLSAGALGATATRTDPTAIKSYLDGIRPALDIDGNGTPDALTDGLLILRYMFGMRGATLIAGAVAPGATRQSAPDIEAYIATLMP